MEAVSRKSWRTFGLCAVVVFMVALDATVVVAAFPALRKSFAGATPADLSWALNGYTIVYAALLVACGRLADRYGCKRCFLGGIALFTLASGGCAIAGNAVWLAAARVFQAIGAALLTPASLALILADFPPQQRQKAVSLWSAVGALAATIGPFLGSAIIEWASWPMIFLLNLPIGIVAFWRGWRELKETIVPETRGRFDFVGTALLIMGIGALSFGIVQAGENGWRATSTQIGLATGFALLIWFVTRARRRADGALNLTLFVDRNYRWASVATFVFGAAFSMMFLSFYLFMTGIWRYAQSTAGLAATPGPLIVILFVIFTSNLAGRIGHRKLLVAGGLLYAVSNFWLASRILNQPDYLATWLPGQILGGLSIGLLLPNLTGAAVIGLQPTRFAVGNAVNSALRQLGGSLGVAVGIALVGSVHADLSHFKIVYFCLAFAGLLIAVLSLPIDTLASNTE